MSNLNIALDLATAGIFVFPAHAKWNEAAQKIDKRPAISGWRAAATTDLEQIKKWWATFPEAVPGIELEHVPPELNLRGFPWGD